MGHERLKHIKHTLLTCIESQVNNIYEADASELGAAIDMLKDLEEAMYYCTVTEAMLGNEKHNDWGMEKMCCSDPILEEDDMKPMHHNPHEGRSPMCRKAYMEAKQMHGDKATQLRELEKYMQELTTDIVEMISDASPEEKQYLEKKINTLAVKIGQMK